METLGAVYEFLKPYFAVIALAVTWGGFAFAWWRRREQWRRKEFLGRVNVSLNLFGDTLSMRTLLEVETTAVWPNAHGVRLLNAAAARTSPADPFIRLAAPADRDYLHRAIKNALSELCPTAFIAAALGEKVRTGVFLFAVTCERYPEIRTIKLRVLLVEQNALRETARTHGLEPGDQRDRRRAALRCELNPLLPRPHGFFAHQVQAEYLLVEALGALRVGNRDRNNLERTDGHRLHLLVTGCE